jgi:hypothetical protein
MQAPRARRERLDLNRSKECYNNCVSIARLSSLFRRQPAASRWRADHDSPGSLRVIPETAAERVAFRRALESSRAGRGPSTFRS